MSEPLTAPGLLTEATLVGRAQDGDVASFELLVRRYQAQIFRFAHRMVSDRGEAEDITQDTFVLVWRQLPTLADPAAFRGWLYQIATRGCLSLLRVRARRRTTTLAADQLQNAHEQQPPGPLQPQQAPDPQTEVEHTEQRRDLATALRALPDDQRACWVLREIHELPYNEIAIAVAIPLSTVRGRIARARHNLEKGMVTWR